MLTHLSRSWLALGLLGSYPIATASRAPIDPCAAVAGKKWVSPREARACLSAWPAEAELKENVIEVVNKTLAFHTSTNYQIQAQGAYKYDVHEDLKADLARIHGQKYESDFEFHLDMYRSFKRVNDGHCGVYNLCYDGFYVTYLPIPLVLLTHSDGSQHVHIAPEAFKVASAEFGDEIEFWQNALPGELKGKLSSLSGAEILLINGEDPFVAVNQNTLVTGGYQSFGTRQNSYFSSYHRGTSGWDYMMGNFAQQAHPLIDEVTITIQRVDSTIAETITLPYRSRIGSSAKNFTDLASFRENNCKATSKTNGDDLYHTVHSLEALEEPAAISYFQQAPPISRRETRKHAMNVILDGAPLSDIDLPTVLQPSLPALNESYSVAQFYMLDDAVTGVLALGSFSAKNFTLFGQSLLDGLLGLKAKGAEKLVVDVTNNGGGYICIAHWLHRLIIGPKSTTEPQAGLDTTTRAGPLAQLIVDKISKGGDPDEYLLYNPTSWRNGTHVTFEEKSRWLHPLVETTINGHEDAFSQRIGQECQPFSWKAPKKALFAPEDVVIISNGRCASSCSLFSITMHKLEGVKTIVVGGKADVPQKYCGTVGGQSTDFSSIDTEIKTTGLKNHTLAPPDFITNSVQGITWRLGYAIDDPNEPEEWQDQPADLNWPLTLATVNNPVALWNEISGKIWTQPKPSQDPMHVPFRVQTY